MNSKNAGKIWLIALIILALIAGVSYFFIIIKKCALPVEYSIGSIDERFNLNQEDVLEITNDAAFRWNDQSNTNLLLYNPNAPLKINLVYDQRQADLDRINNKINTLTDSKDSLETSDEKFERLVTDYQKDLADYNSTVSYWNSRGGAPPAVYQELQQEKNNLDEKRSNLMELSNLLNFEAQNYNEDLADLQDKLDQRKNLIVTQGIYDGNTNTINIYTFGNDQELRLVLMHEFGHALGLGHAQNPNSIMYELLDTQDLENPTLTNEDLQLLDKQCNLKDLVSISPDRITLAV